MGSRDGISGIGVAAVTGGAILLWSALRGKSWSATLRDLLKGSTPVNTQDYPINASSPTVSPSAVTASGPARTVCASEFGGPHDPGTGSHGYKGDNLNGTMAFAELRMGTSLGGLPYKARVQVTYKGRSVIATKLDIGAGGNGCGGHTRDIDLWYETAAALGFSGLDTVQIQIL